VEDPFIVSTGGYFNFPLPVNQLWIAVDPVKVIGIVIVYDLSSLQLMNLNLHTLNCCVIWRKAWDSNPRAQ
jgi:hypothetical protein